MKIAFDIGGVLSKYPHIFRPLIKVLYYAAADVSVCYISDMHPPEKIADWLKRNDFPFNVENIHSADYTTHGERCKAIVCGQISVDILVDDFPGYVAIPGSPLVRLLVMPDPGLPYYHDDWKTDGSEGNFGRRRT